MRLKSQAKRVEKMKQVLSEQIGEDVTALPGYNVQGVNQAFEQGRCVRYRPDLQGDDWEAFLESHALHHHVTNGSIDQALDLVLDSGGRSLSVVGAKEARSPPRDRPRLSDRVVHAP